jgi:hypothetical protein
MFSGCVTLRGGFCSEYLSGHQLYSIGGGGGSSKLTLNSICSRMGFEILAATTIKITVL